MKTLSMQNIPVVKLKKLPMCCKVLRMVDIESSGPFGELRHLEQIQCILHLYPCCIILRAIVFNPRHMGISDPADCARDSLKI